MLPRRRILLKGFAEPCRHGMLRAVSVPGIESEFHAHPVAHLYRGRFAHNAVEVEIKAAVADRHQVDAVAMGRLSVQPEEHGNGPPAAGPEDSSPPGFNENVGIDSADLNDPVEGAA